jgi:hypothetical protein
MGDKNKINIDNPKTKTDYEVRDMEWNNIIGWGVIVLLIGLGMKLYKKK